jgi:hypothetical protein
MEIPHMKKRALLVGINYAGTSNELRGCINDSNNMQSFLTSRGFTDIKLVLEKEATTAGIVAGLNWLVSDTAPGDVIVFHYSGHGSQLPSRAEVDGFEEIICPIDLNWMDKVITDDTLRIIFNKVPNGVNTTVILDCCHSGTMLDQVESLLTKELSAPNASIATKDSRYMAPPPNIALKLEDRELVDWQTSKDVNATALLIAGCHANQTSADAFIDGQAQGAATAALLKSAKANMSITYKNLTTEMQDFMVKNEFEQIPQLDGSPSLYDQVFIEPYSFTIMPSEIVSEPGTQTTSSGTAQNKVLYIAGAILALVALFLTLH